MISSAPSNPHVEVELVEREPFDAPLGTIRPGGTLLPYGTILPSIREVEHLNAKIRLFITGSVRGEINSQQYGDFPPIINHVFLDDCEYLLDASACKSSCLLIVYLLLTDCIVSQDTTPMHVYNRPRLQLHYPLMVIAHIDRSGPEQKVRFSPYFNRLYKLYKTGNYRGGFHVLWVGPKFWDLQVVHREFDGSLWRAPLPPRIATARRASGTLSDEYSPFHPFLGPNNTRLSDAPIGEGAMVLHPTLSNYCQRHSQFDPYSLNPPRGIRNTLRPASSDGTNPNAHLIRIWRNMRELRRANQQPVREPSEESVDGSYEEELEVAAASKSPFVFTTVFPDSFTIHSC